MRFFMDYFADISLMIYNFGIPNCAIKLIYFVKQYVLIPFFKRLVIISVEGKKIFIIPFLSIIS